VTKANTYAELLQLTDTKGHFGPYGGRFVSEKLSYALEELEETYNTLSQKPEYQHEFDKHLANYVVSHSPLYPAER